MGTTLTGTTPANTYDSLIKVTDNGPLSGTAKYLSDGLGNDSTLALSTGNVGIGTTSLAARLHVFGNVGDMLRLDRDNTGAVGNQIAFRHSNAGTLIETATINVVSTANADTGSLVLSTKPTGGSVTERMRITSDGLVGIGTSSPSSFSVLSLAKNGVSEYASVSCSNSSSTATLFVGVGGSSVANTALRNNAYILNVAASDLILGTGDFERMRITSTGNVGIGTNNPTTKLQVDGGNLTVSGISYPSLILDSDASAVNFSVYSASSNDYLGISNGTSDLAVFKTSGNVGIGTSSPQAKLAIKDGTNTDIEFFSEATGVAIQSFNRTSSQGGYFRVLAGDGEKIRVTNDGLTFNGDTASANALDDYEEGTWTATMLGVGSNPTTPVTTTATYTKIGRQVSVIGYFSGSNTTGASGVVNVSGLPFTSASAVGVTSGSASSNLFDFAGGTSLQCYVSASSTIVEFVVSSDDSAWINLTHTAGTGRALSFNLTYFV